MKIHLPYSLRLALLCSVCVASYAYAETNSFDYSNKRTPLTGSFDLEEYENVTFQDNLVNFATRKYSYSAQYGNKTYTTTYTYSSGGAIYVGDGETVNISKNGNIVFDGNSAVKGGSTRAQGGAIGVSSTGTLNFDSNSSVTFSNNTSTQDAGAIYACTNSLNFINNDGVL